ncbi:AMP-binding protein [Kitasatospora sp. LaBMicrA B282]|uniref:AMP-binding protein n=1 Tax=Kitasatospora sp. LaBMicrA B282 TaxID=3420949 RepID=UPI003D1477A9
MPDTPTDTPAATPAFAALRPAPLDLARRHAAGVWRTDTLLDDLARHRAAAPDALAVVAAELGPDGRPSVVRLSYAQYAERVDRFAAALHRLGVRAGQVVALQLPNRWQVGPLVLACARLGAVAAPIMCTIRPRELARVLRRVEAAVCITVDRWEGFEHAAALAELAPGLPALRHRVVLATDPATAGESGGALDFAAVFEQADPVAVPLDTAADADRVALVLFTSGTSGEPKAALHTLNTSYAWYAEIGATDGVGPGTRVYTPHAHMHSAGLNFGLFMPLHFGATAVLVDRWEPAAVAPFLIEQGADWLLAAPVYLFALIEALAQQPHGLRAAARSGATTVPQRLFTEAAKAFGSQLGVIWGMTEGASAYTRPAELRDHPELVGRTVGRPGPSCEIDLRAEHPIDEARPGALFARGGSLCLATLGRDNGTLTVLAEHDDGWYETGDLAAPDGHGGYRLLGRAADRIGSVFMIPVADVESALLEHPAVRDVALVGYPDGQGGESACAVVVAEQAPPTLAELRGHLTGLGMTEWYLPARLELLPELPRNETGKVRKDLLRRRLDPGEPVN